MFKTPTRPPVRVRRAGRRTPDITDGVSYGWVRVQDRVLAVAVHSAASPEREGTVLIAGSVGRERVTTQRTVLHVARALAAEGWRVVRFDWSGTGLSPWADEVQPAQQWAEDLEAVRRWAARSGPVHGVGIRLGGTVMASSAAEDWASRHIWWPVSGKRWLRHHSGLRRMAGDTLPRRETPGTELTGMYLDPEGTAALNHLPEPHHDSADRLYVLEGPGMDALPFDVNPLVARVPPEAASTIAAALDVAGTRSSAAAPPQHPSPALAPEESVEISVAGTPVRLHHARVGRGNRPAVITSPLHLQPRAPGMVFVSLGSESMEAPGSLSMRTSVAASARGAVCLLVERSDTGELARSGQTQDSNPYAWYTHREAREAVQRLAELTTGPLLAVGVCLGSWALATSAHRLPRHVTGRLSLYVVNNVAWQRTPWYYWRQGRTDGIPQQVTPGVEDTPPSGAGETTPVISAKGLLKVVLRPVVRGVRHVAVAGPPWVNSLAAEVGVVDLPGPLLRRLSRIPGLFVDAVFGPADAHQARVSAGPLGAGGRVTVLDPLDHSLHAAASQRALFEYLLSEVAASQRARAGKSHGASA